MFYYQYLSTSVLLLLLLFVIPFIQGVYNYILLPKANHASRLYSAAAILWLQCTLHIMLFPMLNVLYLYISTLLSMCAVSNMAVFCSYLMS
jgi:hypothetical protein